MQMFMLVEDCAHRWGEKLKAFQAWAVVSVRVSFRGHDAAFCPVS